MAIKKMVSLPDIPNLGFREVEGYFRVEDVSQPRASQAITFLLKGYEPGAAVAFSEQRFTMAPTADVYPAAYALVKASSDDVWEDC